LIDSSNSSNFFLKFLTFLEQNKTKIDLNNCNLSITSFKEQFKKQENTDQKSKKQEKVRKATSNVEIEIEASEPQKKLKKRGKKN